MSDDLSRDEVVARALDAVAVPDYEPGFWDRLEARLSAEGFPGLGVGSLEEPAVPDEVPAALTLAGLGPIGPGPEPEAPASVPVEPPAAVVVPLEVTPVPAALAAAAPAARRRGLALLGAAAAVAAAVLTLQLVDGAPQDPLETAAPGGSAEPSFAAPGGGSSSPDGSGTGAAELAQPDDRDPLDDTTGRSGGDDHPIPGTAVGSSPRAGTAAGPGGTGSTALTARAPLPEAATPQQAFATWATALEEGDVDAALAVTGPRTRRRHGTSGSLAAVAQAWAADYAAWGDGSGGRVEEIEAGSSGESPVVVLVLRDALDGDGPITGRLDLPVVLTADGWRVEPDAGARTQAAAVLVGPPADGSTPSSTVAKDHVIEVPAARSGTYTFDLDGKEQATVPASKAVDGVVRWDPPDRAMTPGRHVVVVVHVTEDTITTSTVAFEVG